MRYLRFYQALVRTRLSKDLVYRFNFWVAFITDLVIMALQTFVFVAIYQHADAIGGWNREQILVFMATFIIVNGLTMGIFFFGVLRIPWLIRTGGLDLEITKPVNTAFLVLFKHFDLGGLLGLVPGVVLLVVTVVHYHVPVGATGVLAYVLLVVLMTALHLALMLSFRLPAFWTVRADSLTEMAGELSSFAWRVPGVALRGLERLWFMVIVPFALIATVPTTALTGALSTKGLLVVLAVTLVHMVFAAGAWRISLRHYSSASS